MPITDSGEFVRRTDTTLTSLLEEELRAEFGVDIDLSESSVFSTLVQSLATVLAENQEADLEEVYNSAFLETATGVNLDRVVEIIGVTRLSATRATGVVKWTRNSPTTSNVSVQSGTIVQSDESDPVSYLTRDFITLPFYDGFEDNDISDYTGDTGTAFEAATDEAFSGSFSLKATDSGNIFRTDKTVRNGDNISCRVRSDVSDSVGEVWFGTQDAANTYKATVDATGEFSLEKVVSGSPTTLDSSAGLSVPLDSWNEVEVDWGVRNQNDNAKITVRLLDSTNNEIASLETTDGEWLSGGFGFGSTSVNAVWFDSYASRGRAVDVIAEEGGLDGNVGPNSVTVVPSLPTGVQGVTNPFTIGDDSFTLLDGSTYTSGEDEETDRQLRERTQASLGESGSSTFNAISSALQNSENVPNVVSVKGFENAEPTTDSDGRPPFSIEFVIFGGTEQDIVDTIGRTKGATTQTTGGHVGNLVTGTWTSTVTDDQFQIEFSRPTELSVDFTIDIVVDDSYVGDTEIRDRIVDYVGGTLTNGTAEVGLDVGEDVVINQVEDVIVGPSDTGVIGISSLSTTPSLTTNANGLEVVEVGPSEVATTNGTDTSITINVTTV